jgi:hypothetical protein
MINQAKGLTSGPNVLQTCLSQNIRNHLRVRWGRRRDCDLTGSGDRLPRAEVSKAGPATRCLRCEDVDVGRAPAPSDSTEIAPRRSVSAP